MYFLLNVFAGLQFCQRPITYFDPDQAQGRESDSGGHPPDLPVTALPDG
jgi:hypothetical protein